MIDPLLLPVLSALGGVALAQGVAMLQSWLDRKHKREILLRTKYEELGLHFLASMKLPGELLKCESHEATLEVVHQGDGNKIHMLALVYFPLLRQATGNYIQSYSALASTAIALYNPDDNRPLGKQAFNHPQFTAAAPALSSPRDLPGNVTVLGGARGGAGSRAASSSANAITFSQE